MTLLCLEIDDLGLADVVVAVEDALRGRVRGYVVTPNVDHLVRLRQHAAFRAAYAAATFRLADGVPLVWASRLLGRPLRARVAGADLLPALCRMAARAGHTVFFLGGRPGVAPRR
mgnify:CR=1 FL=1